MTRKLQEAKKKLPSNDEVVVEVEKDQKTGRMSFKPHYHNADPYNGGAPSMRIFTNPKADNMSVGDRARARIIKMRKAAKPNARGVTILIMEVKLIP